jgi:hypothetical protein
VVADWRECWEEIFASAPPRPSSCEWSIQGALESLIAGHLRDDTPATPTVTGQRFIALLTRHAFGESRVCPWFAREHKLPIPEEERIGSRVSVAPDYAAGTDGHVVLIELKSEQASARIDQPDEYLRYGGLRHSDAHAI